MKNKIKLIIFDLDGTLINSLKDITNALNYSLQQLHIHKFTPNQIKELIGGGVTKLIEKSLRKIDINNYEVRIPAKKFKEYYSEHCIDNTRLYPYVIQTLKKLKKYKKAVVSNKPEIFCKKILKELNISEYFDIIVGGDTTKRKKPDPEPIIYVLNKLGIKREETVIVGDGETDIEAGKKAKIKTIAVSYGFRKKEQLKEADYLIDEIKEILKILKI